MRSLLKKKRTVKKGQERVDVRISDRDGETALMSAVRSGDKRVVEGLLLALEHCAARSDAGGGDGTVEGEEGQGDAGTVVEEVVSMSNRDEETALHLAAAAAPQGSRVGIVRMFIGEGVE